MNKRVGGLILLSLIPMLGGLMRLRGLSIGDATMDGHARFAADPIPAVLHIIGATSFATLGALQFLPSLRRNAWHRLVGRVISALGIVAMLAGTWMILTWPHKPLDSAYLSFFRVTAALAMAGFIAFSVREARRGAIDSHARWIARLRHRRRGRHAGVHARSDGVQRVAADRAHQRGALHARISHQPRGR